MGLGAEALRQCYEEINNFNNLTISVEALNDFKLSLRSNF